MRSRLNRILATLPTILFILPAAVADDAPPIPAPPTNAPTFIVQRIAPDGAITLLDPTGVHTIALASVVFPTEESQLTRARDFLEQLLVGERVCFATQTVAKAPPASAAESKSLAGNLFRLPDGLFVNLDMIRQGYATGGKYKSKHDRPEFQYYEKIARDCGKGVWAVPPLATAANPSDASPSESTQKAAPTPKTGHTAQSSSPSSSGTKTVDLKSITVYVTKSGTKYHRQNCQHARKSGQPISLEEALRRGLEPCKRCNPPTKENPTP